MHVNYSSHKNIYVLFTYKYGIFIGVVSNNILARNKKLLTRDRTFFNNKTSSQSENGNYDGLKLSIGNGCQ